MSVESDSSWTSSVDSLRRGGRTVSPCTYGVPVIDAPEEILAGLDPEQRRVATSFGGPVCVIAGAGTGKTRAITHRIAYGACTGRLDPRRTLAVTFTTRAAGTMRTRLEGLGVHGVQARTIHSAALRQIKYFWPRAYGCELPPVSTKRFPMLAQAAQRCGLSTDTALLRDLSAEVSWAKVSNVTITDYPPLARARQRAVAGVSSDTVGRVLAGYEAVKHEAAVIDLDDILLCAAGLLADHPDILDQVHDQYRHFVVDEYQDVSPIQHTLLELWFGDRDDVCVVGDPHQAIHAFAGAKARYLINFPREHPDTIEVRLVRNYRSTAPIIDLANTLLTHHLGKEEARFHNLGVKLRSQTGQGEPPIYRAFDDEASESAAIATWLRGQRDDGVPWSQMAILHRTNAQTAPLELALSDLDVPYVVKDAERFYERAEVKQALAALTRALQADPQAPGQRAREVLEDQGWTPQPPEGSGMVRQRWESLQALQEVAQSVSRNSPSAGLAGIVTELGERARRQDIPVTDGVTLCTMHASKGLEWDVVALFGVSDSMVPFILADKHEEIAEERRLLHVAVTRARRHLWISYSRSASSRNRFGISRFLRGLPGTPTQTRRRPRRTGQKRKVTTCSVCNGPMTVASDQKLGHHLACEVGVDVELVDQLRQWRKERAERDSMPPFVVFTDVTMLAIAEHEPRTQEDLLAIPGIGRRKVELYGDEILRIITPDA